MFFRINCNINCDIKVNPNTSIVIDVSQLDEHGTVISHNSSFLLSYTWILYKVVHTKRKRRDLESLGLLNEAELTEIELEDHAATGFIFCLRSVRVNKFFL